MRAVYNSTQVKEIDMKLGKRWIWVGLVFLGLIIILLVLYLVRGVEKEDLDQSARNGANGQFILLEDGYTHYHLEGPDDGSLVIFVHGFSVPSYVWEPNTRALNSAGYRTLRYDLYGRGFSDRPDLEYDHQLFIRQLEGLIAGLSLDEAQVVVGLSMGGPIAASYQSRNADKVKGLILVAPEIKTSGVNDIFPLNLPGVGEYLMFAVMEPYVLPRLQTNDFYQPELFPDWEEIYREQFLYKGTGQALLSTVRNLVDLRPEEIYAEVNDLEIPVLLIWGEDDQTIGWDQILILKEILPDLDLRVIENAGHLVNYEKAVEINPLFFEFLKQVEW
jgi:pimeloyl-ACP methyl ester carboxylesterase